MCCARLYRAKTLNLYTATREGLINAFLTHYGRPKFKTLTGVRWNYIVFLDNNNPNLHFKKNKKFIHPCNAECKTKNKCKALSKSYTEQILNTISNGIDIGINFIVCSDMFTNASIIKVINPEEFLNVLEALRIVYDIII